MAPIYEIPKLYDRHFVMAGSTHPNFQNIH